MKSRKARFLLLPVLLGLLPVESLLAAPDSRTVAVTVTATVMRHTEMRLDPPSSGGFARTSRGASEASWLVVTGNSSARAFTRAVSQDRGEFLPAAQSDRPAVLEVTVFEP